MVDPVIVTSSVDVGDGSVGRSFSATIGSRDEGPPLGIGLMVASGSASVSVLMVFWLSFSRHF